MNYVNLYINFLKPFIKIKRPLKVIFDCSNGTAGLVVRQLKIENLKLKIINGKPNGNFPAHGSNPLKVGAISRLGRTVLRQRADLGVIFDADGDRIFLIDNKGRFIDPDIIARLLIWHLKPKKVVIGVRTGWLIKNYQLSIINYQLLISKVGHYFIKKLMKQKKADFGAERSGHYYFKDFFYAESGILAAIKVINAVSRLPYSLADFVDLLPQYFRSGEISVRRQVPRQRRGSPQAAGVRINKLFKKIEREYRKKAEKNLRTDGLTMIFNNYWFNIRPSNTEPLIRLNIEAKSKKLLQRERKRLTAILRKM